MIGDCLDSSKNKRNNPMRKFLNDCHFKKIFCQIKQNSQELKQYYNLCEIDETLLFIDVRLYAIIHPSTNKFINILSFSKHELSKKSK